MPFQTGDKVHAFAGGVLRVGTYQGEVTGACVPDKEPHSLIYLTDGSGMHYICPTISLRHSKDHQPLVSSRY